MPFNEVKTLCAQFHGRVATPMNAEENRALKDLVTEEAFLGITDQETCSWVASENLGEGKETGT